MTKPAQPPVTRTYRALKGLAWIVATVFYRRTDVTGDEEFLTPGRPTVVVANHTNNLADPVLMLAKLPGHPRFLAAGSWWKFAPARWLFRLAGVVPIYRQRDGGGTEANRSTFAACHEALREGSTLALFPEGEVNAQPSLMPLKTGAARIALGAAAEAGVADVVVLPVGLVYEDQGRFRSLAAMQVGVPVPVDAWLEEYRTDPRAAIHGLTDEVARGLRAVTVNHASWEDARLVDRAATLSLADGQPGLRRFAERNELRRELAGALAAGGRAEVDELASTVSRHDHDLAQLGLDGGRAIPALGRNARERRRVGAQLMVLAPGAAVGAVANAPVAVLVRAASTFVRDPSWLATAKGVAGLGLCPIVWGTEAFLVRRFGRRAVIGVLVAAPLGGFAWIAWRERRRQWRLVEREQQLLEFRADELRAVASSRARVQDQVQKMVRAATPREIPTSV